MKVDPGDDLTGAVESAYDELFEANAVLIEATRQEIKNLTAIRDQFLFQVDQIQQAITLLVMTVEATAKATGDMLLTQHGISIEEEVLDEEDGTTL